MNFGYRVSFKNIDRGFIELSGPLGLSYLVRSLSTRVASVQTGQLNHYIFFIVISCLIIFSLFLPGLAFDFKLDSYILGLF
jgi:hypothetical protein